MSNRYGYSGSVGHTQAIKSNSGVFSPNEIIDLDLDNVWFNAGQLELIETQTLSGTPATLSFDSIKETEYNVHFMTITNFKPQTDNRHLSIQFKVAGSADTDNDYQYCMQRQNVSTGAELNSGNDSRIYLAYNCGIATGESLNGQFYIYNAGDSTKYTYLTQHFIHVNKDTNISTNFGSGVHDQLDSVNGLQFQTSGGNLEHGVFSLYGIKEYS